ncbi:hypothetical protein [Mucilaginibacter ginkgonis]|uniref:Lipoprotein n=1 Tax=Mucilaginibacter ginkgonis TaxID=2682091 RepID=A0A6I4I1G5_9SPHI|nr:hypothetical protein [Mucilaginibacter ginkgonis]QQL48542.1 hypothetical protein GO620_010095 [Mucilaginibacter ginkgonis]
MKKSILFIALLASFAGTLSSCAVRADYGYRNHYDRYHHYNGYDRGYHHY